MIFQKILVPTDGSESNKTAVREGMDLAKLTGGRITALYVIDQSVYANMPMDSTVANLYETLKAEAESAVNYVRDRCADEGIACDAVVVEGVPAKTITAMAEEHDIIVMGTIGKKGMTKLLMGSVTEKVIDKAECPIMVVSTSVRCEL